MHVPTAITILLFPKRVRLIKITVMCKMLMVLYQQVVQALVIQVLQLAVVKLAVVTKFLVLMKNSFISLFYKLASLTLSSEHFTMFHMSKLSRKFTSYTTMLTRSILLLCMQKRHNHNFFYYNIFNFRNK